MLSRSLDTYGPKPYKFIGFGDIYGTKPYKFIGFGDIHGTKPYEFIGFGAMARARRAVLRPAMVTGPGTRAHFGFNT